MTKVWCVFENNYYEDPLRNIFSTKEKADEWAALINSTYKLTNPEEGSYYVDDWDVD